MKKNGIYNTDDNLKLEVQSMNLFSEIKVKDLSVIRTLSRLEYGEYKMKLLDAPIMLLDAPESIIQELDVPSIQLNVCAKLYGVPDWTKREESRYLS